VSLMAHPAIQRNARKGGQGRRNRVVECGRMKIPPVNKPKRALLWVKLKGYDITGFSR